MNKFLPIVLLFLSFSCFAGTMVIPGCAPDTVEKWQSKVYAEINESFFHPKPPREQKINPTYHYSGLLMPGMVHMWVEKRGLIINPELTQSSQWELYDETMLDAIAASKFPELNCSTERMFEFSITFNYGFNRVGRF